MRRLRDRLFSAAAALGAIVIISMSLAAIFGVRPVIVASGSMGDAVPTGAVALVRETPVDALRLDDVVAVSNGDRTILHRIVDIEPTPHPMVSSLELQGDANATPDPDRYDVAEAERVIAVVQHLGWLIGAAQHPLSWIVVALALGVCLTTAMWDGSAAGTVGDHHATSSSAS